MMNEEMSVDSLVESMNMLRSKAETLKNRIDMAKVDDLDQIRTAYTTGLAQKWSALSRMDQQPNTLEELQQRIENLTNFVSEFADVVQRPRRAGIAQKLDTWLRGWVRRGRSVKWQTYLDDATEEQLSEVETLLEKLEPVDLGDEKIEEKVRQWLKNRIKRLGAAEKHPDHLIRWLESVNRNLVDARTLVDELLLPLSEYKSEEGEPPIITQIRGDWGKQLRDRIAAIECDQESLELNDFLAKNQKEWEAIERSLPNLRAVLMTCSEAEKALVQRQVKSWKSVDNAQIEELINAITKLESDKKYLEENLAVLDVDLTVRPATTEEIQDLISARPDMPSPDKYSSLSEFQRAMEKCKGDADAWLKQCADLYRKIRKRIESWQNLSLPEDLLQRFKQLKEGAGDDLTSLEQLAELSWDLQEAEKKVRAYVEKTLDPQERTLWERLQELKMAGKSDVNLNELDTGEPVEQVTNIIVKLAKQGLIRVRIEI